MILDQRADSAAMNLPKSAAEPPPMPRFDLPQVAPAHTAAAARGGEARAVEAYAKAGEALGFGLARLIAILTPTRIVLAGPGTRAMELIAPHLHRAIEEGMVDELRRNLEIETVPIGTDMIMPTGLKSFSGSKGSLP